MILPKKVTIIEVGPRDGLQNEKAFIPTDEKKAFITALKKAGFKEMELTSLVSPKWVPQLADAEEIIESCVDVATRNFVLVPNEKGAKRLYASRANAVAVFVGTSDTFNKKNINKMTKESLRELKPLISDFKRKGYFVRASISTAFHCPYEGKISEEKTLSLCNQFVDYGVDELCVADTIGMATPTEVYSLFTKLKATFPNILISAHFHDTRKMGLANVFAALQAGIDRFDSSAGGLGGCPFAPGASGNVATEDVVYMLEQMGISTGIHLDELTKALAIIRPYLSRPLDSAYLKTTGQLS
ncbi:hydroxymethylglutaryl-CoA lyase [Fervidibacillus halotolerans]|uniref:Hydroxymethylglutaryl-CoA lyase n=1 Tax=Fervidibacillus halotolerans TaxID=2980027 RepID=A0A9E8RYH6_9BACI|nr:hydroxymethylglutaryl-CoA lyase [Fervidibacillus halotolerans]WAA13830.1 hydroxymethylglutaryl-CoA lyase [Fervidibacillus halotolerans]